MRAALITFSLLVAATTPARADSKAEAKKHLERAMAAHRDARYADALTELKIAYTLDPQPALLYAIGQVHVMQGQCAEAVTFYQRFIDAKPDPAQAAKASQAIETCKKLETDKPKPDPIEPVKPVEPPPPPAPPLRIETTIAPWYTDWVGDALVGAGILTGVASMLFYRAALSDRDAADTVMSYDRYDELLAESQSKQTLAIGFAAGAAVLVAAGVVSYVVRDRKVETRTLLAAPTREGGTVTWVVRF